MQAITIDARGIAAPSLSSIVSQLYHFQNMLKLNTGPKKLVNDQILIPIQGTCS